MKYNSFEGAKDSKVAMCVVESFLKTLQNTNIIEFSHVKKCTIIHKINYISVQKYTFLIVTICKISHFYLFFKMSFLKLVHKHFLELVTNFSKLVRAIMKIIAKYKNIILQKGYAESEEQAELIAETLYQLAFTTVQDYIIKRRF